MFRAACRLETSRIAILADNAVGQTGECIIVARDCETFVGSNGFAGCVADPLSPQELQGLRERPTLRTRHAQGLFRPDLGPSGWQLQDGVSSLVRQDGPPGAKALANGNDASTCHPTGPDPTQTAAGRCGSMSREQAATRGRRPAGDAIASRRAGTSNGRPIRAPRRLCDHSPVQSVSNQSSLCSFPIRRPRLVERARRRQRCRCRLYVSARRKNS